MDRKESKAPAPQPIETREEAVHVIRQVASGSLNKKWFALNVAVRVLQFLLAPLLFVLSLKNADGDMNLSFLLHGAGLVVTILISGVLLLGFLMTVRSIWKGYRKMQKIVTEEYRYRNESDLIRLAYKLRRDDERLKSPSGCAKYFLARFAVAVIELLPLLVLFLLTTIAHLLVR